MKNKLLLPALLALGSFLQPAFAQVSSEALGTVRYEVRYQLKGIDTKVADATVSLKEHSSADIGRALHAQAVIRATSVFRLIMNAEYVADSYLFPDGQRPYYYMNPIKKGGKTGKFECSYDKDTKTITMLFLKPSADSVRKTFPLDGRTMDLLSLLQYVRFHSLTAGKSEAMHVLKAGFSVPATLTCQGVDTERFPGRKTERFLLDLKEQGLMENGSGNRILVWRSTGSDRQLVGMEVNLGSGVMTVSIKE